MLLVLTCQPQKIRDVTMKSFFNQAVFLSLFFLLVSCSAPPVSSNAPIEITSTPTTVSRTETTSSDTQIKVIPTNDPDYPLLAIFPGGEILVIKTLHSLPVDYSSIYNVILINPDDSSLVVYFSDGVPVQAFFEGNWIELADTQSDTTSITIISQNEKIITLYNVPFERSQIRSETIQASDEIELIEFASSALRVFSCAASSVIDDDWVNILEAGCALSESSGYVVVLEAEGESIKCGGEVANENLIPVLECATLVVDSAKNIEASVPEYKIVTVTESPATSESPATPLLIGVLITYEGNSISCTCQNCVCDSNPFFRVILSIDESGNVEGVLKKYTELFPEIPLSGTVDKFTGSVMSEQMLAYLEFEGSLSNEGNVIFAILTAVFQESGTSGVRELVLYRMDQ